MNKVTTFPLDQICAEGYLQRDLVNHFFQHPEQPSGLNLAEVRRYVTNILAGDEEPVEVFLEKGQYHIHPDYRELATAYHYAGRNNIPITLLSVDDSRVPAYVRNGVSIDPSPREAWN